MQLIIRLLSDLCTYSGDTHNSLVDTDVVYDENGIPYIPAKRIKGCIREAALEMVELGIAPSELHEIFGKEGQQSSAFSLSNAYIENYGEVTDGPIHLYAGADGSESGDRHCSGKFAEKNPGCKKRSGIYSRMQLEQTGIFPGTSGTGSIPCETYGNVQDKRSGTG